MKEAVEHLKAVHTVQQFSKQKKLWKKGQKIIVAVSGGIDSVSLLDILLRLQRVNDFDLAVAHVNYRLRGKDSDYDEKLVTSLAAQNGLPCFVYSVDTKKIRDDEKKTLQETARNIRYSFFDTLKKSLHADLIATAHNANDNAETILINIFRGCGIDGIAGIPVRRNDIIRPLLCLSRKEIETYVRRRKLKFREDSSNQKSDYTRNFIRHQIIPRVERRINPSLVATLQEESKNFSANALFVRQYIKSIFPAIVTAGGERIAVAVQKLESEDRFIQQMIAREILEMLGIEPASSTITSIMSLVENNRGKQAEIGRGWTAERLENEIHIAKQPPKKNFSVLVEREGTISTQDFVLTIKKSALSDNKRGYRSSTLYNEYVDASKIEFPLTIRSWHEGDSFFPLGMKGKKKVSDFFIDTKLSKNEKQSVPIIECNKKIVWIAGYRLDDRFKIGPSTTGVYQLTLTRLNGKKNDRR